MNDPRLEKMRDLLVIAVSRLCEQHRRLTLLSADVLALQAAIKGTPLASVYQKNKRVLKATHNDLAIPDSDDALSAVIQQLKAL